MRHRRYYYKGGNRCLFKEGRYLYLQERRLWRNSFDIKRGITLELDKEAYRFLEMCNGRFNRFQIQTDK